MAIGDPFYSQSTLAAQQIANAQYQQGLAQYQQGQYPQGLAGIGNSSLGSLGGIAGAAPYASYSSGMVMGTISFTDAMGQTWALTVDAACVTAMHAISNLHLSKLGANIYPNGPIHAILNDGDFSLDEMEKAEKIIEELKDG